MPTVYVQVTKNSTVNQNKPTTNFPASTIYYFAVGGANWSGGSSGGIDDKDYCRAWLGFSLSSIPTNATIVSATLSMKDFATFADYASVAINVKRCTDNSWTETGITWNNAPNGSVSGSTTYIAYGNSQGESAMDGDVTADVSAALASRAVTWRLDEDDGNPSYGTNIASRTNFALPIPTLTIVYTVPASGAGALFFGSD